MSSHSIRQGAANRLAPVRLHLVLCTLIFWANCPAWAVGGSLSGTVRNAADGLPLYGATVLADSTGDWSAPDLTAYTDRNGNYQITNVPAGTYAIRFQQAFKVPCDTNATVVAGAETIVNCSLGTAAMLQGSVQDATDRLPIEGAQVLAVRQGTPPGSDVVVTTQTDAFGFYDLPQLAPGTYAVSALHPAYVPSPTQQVVVASGNASLAFQLQRRADHATRADVHAQLLCAISGLQIVAAPVRLQVYQDAAGTVLLLDETQTTGPRGSVVFRGVPKGHFRMSANAEPAGQVHPWWKGHAPAALHTLNGHKQVTFRLEPYKRTVKVRLTPQHAWMNTQPYRSMYCQNFWVELTGADGAGQTYPPRTALTDYDGAVTFEGIPTVPFRLTLRRPGFNLRELDVTPDPTGNFPAFIEMPRPDIRQGTGLRLTLSVPGFVSFDNNGSPAPIMESMGGIVLQGLEDSNTAGYLKRFSLQDATVPLQVDLRQEEGTAWPGTYNLTGSGGFWVERIGADGRSYGAWIEYLIPPTTITILDQTNRVTDVTVPLQIRKAQVSGRLLAADTVVGEDCDLVYLPVTNKTVQFLVHEEMVPWVATGERVAEATTDANGQFQVELLPVQYGIRLPDRAGQESMSDYWGERIVVNNTHSVGWLYPQRKPSNWTGTEPNSAYVLFGGAFDTSKHNSVELLLRRRDTFQVRGFVRHSGKGGVLRERVVFVKPDDTILTAATDELLESGTAAQLLTTGTIVATNLIHVYDTNLSYLFTNLPVGEFFVTVPHARYQQTNTITFTNFQWGAPGYLPATKPPTFDDLLNQHVLLPLQMNTFLTNRGKLAQLVESTGIESNVQVTIYWLDDDMVEHTYEVTPLFVRCAEYGQRLFKYSGQVFTSGMSVIVLHNRNNKHAFYETTIRDVVAYVEEPVEVKPAPYRLDVLARQEAMRELEIPDLSFKVQDDTTGYVTPHTFANHSGSAKLQGPGTNSNWTWKHVDYALVSVTNPVPHVMATVYANLVFDLGSQVLGAGTLEPVSGARVRLLRADGGRLETYTVEGDSDSSGNFRLSGLQEGFRDYFLDVTCPGFVPARVRFSPVPPPYTGSRPLLTLPSPVLLTPIQTALAEPVFDRFGHVLGGVRAVGRGGSAEALNLTWSLAATPFTHTYQLPSFDNPNGTANEPHAFTLRDRITEVWLINARLNLFTQDDMTVSDRVGTNLLPHVAGLPLAEQYPQNKRRLPNPNNPAVVRAWLRDLESGSGSSPATGYSRDPSPQSVFFQKLSVAGAPGLSCSVTGQLNVANLPPGEFLPCLAVATESGAASYALYSFTNSGHQPLQVLRLPTWLAFAADVMTMAGDTLTTYKELKEAHAESVPDGRLSALPDFTGTIKEDDGYLTYDYQLAVQWLEGADMPGADLLGIAPGVLGLDFTSKAGIEFEGRTPTLAFNLGGQISASDIDLQDLAPKIVSKLKIGGEITEVSGQACTVRRAALSAGDWTDFMITTRVGANLEGYVTYNLAGLTSKIPYVGPVLYIADKHGALQFFARADAAARVDSIDTFLTKEAERYLPAYLSGGVLITNGSEYVILPQANARDDEELTRLRHEFGGLRNVSEVRTNYTALGFNFGASLEAKAQVKFARLYGRAGLELTGDEETGLVLGKPSLRVIPNQYGDWPVIRRITGQANLVLTARADLTIAEIGKTWTWPLVHIDHQFGTSNTMHVADLGVFVWRHDGGNFPPVQLVDDGPVLLRSCLPMQRYGASANGLAYLSYDSSRGMMTLMVSFKDGSTWSTPVEVAAAGQILDVELVQLPAPDGRWLLVWCEMDTADLQLAYPRSILKSSVSSAGGWSAPAMVAQLEGQLRELDLVIGPSVSALYLEDANDLVPTQTRISACAFITNGWSPPYVVRAAAPLPAAASAGTGTTSPVPARVAVVDAANVLDSHYWDGQRSFVPSGADHLGIHAGPAQTALALCAATDGHIYAAWLDASLNVHLHRNTPTNTAPANPDYDWNDPALNPWTDLGTILSGVSATELKMAWIEQAGLSQLLLVWSDGASLHHAFVDPVSLTVTGPESITRNPAGQYHDLRLVPLGGLTARVLARFSGPTEEVRQFTLDATTGLLASDSDSDGLDDLRELDLVDADAEDTITSIHGVLPGDDFDHDGFTNGTELAAGSNAADARSVPPLDGVQVTLGLPRAFERDATPGSFVITRAASDPATNALLVHVAPVGGTATPGTDYSVLPDITTQQPGVITVPAQVRSVVVSVMPVADGLPEGDETVELRLLPNVTYTLGRLTNAVLTIVDDAYDAWRHHHFTATQLANPAISGDTADPDRDGNPNLIEFASQLDPLAPNAGPLRLEVVHDETWLESTLSFTRNLDALDSAFQIESRTNLTTAGWLDITPELEVAERAPAPDGETVILRQLQLSTNAPQQYYRLKFIR